MHSKEPGEPRAEMFSMLDFFIWQWENDRSIVFEKLVSVISEYVGNSYYDAE